MTVDYLLLPMLVKFALVGPVSCEIHPKRNEEAFNKSI